MNERHRRSQQAGRARLARLSGEWEQAEDRMGLQRSRFARLADPEAAPRVVSAFNLFQTPEALAARMASLLSPISGPILEPSAGLGRVYRAARAVALEAPVTLVEIAAECCGELYRATEGDPAARLVQGDFLAQTPETLGTFAAIAMNPPFANRGDIEHVTHAFRFLRPGGRLVAVMAASVTTRQDRRASDFRATVEAMGGTFEPLPPGTFREAGTNVATVLLTVQSGIDKTGDSW